MEKGISAMDLQEVYNRGIINVGNLARLKKVMIKANSGEAITIAFIGGSITQGAVASTAESCYAYRVFSWWRDMFPDSNISYINAGVGATTSKFGVARVDEDVLEHQPDIVFVEFSVNDEGTELYKETFEGLIRKILEFPTEPALFMFNNVFYDNGRNAQSIHNMIGKYYDLPIVSMKESLYSEIEKGRVINTDIAPDYLHPNDLGHKLVAGVITHLLNHIYELIMNSDYKISAYELPAAPLTQNRFVTSTRYNNKNSNPILEGFHKDLTPSQGPKDVFRNGWHAKQAGSSIRFEVEGAMIAVQYCKYAKHPAPVAIAIIDGDERNASVLDANFDEDWGNCPYLQDIMVDGAPGKHMVEILITKAAKDEDFYLISLITVK